MSESKSSLPDFVNQEHVEAISENCALKATLSAVMGAGLGFVIGGVFTNMNQPIPTRAIGSTSRAAAAVEDSTWKTVKDGFKQSGRNGVRMAKGFGAAGGLFVASECVVEKYRGQSDIYNGLVGGCMAGAALSWRGGPQAMCLGCVGFAAFSAVIDTSDVYKPEDHQFHELIRPVNGTINSGARSCPSGLETLSSFERRVVPFYLYQFPETDPEVLLACYRRKHGTDYLDKEGSKNTGELYLYGALQNHHWRTVDPREAEVFVVFAFSELSSMCGVCFNTTHAQRQARIAAQLRKSPYVRNCKARDHLLPCMSFKCADVEVRSTELRSVLGRGWVANYYALFYRTHMLCQRRVIVSPFPAQILIQRSSKSWLPSSERETAVAFQGGLLKKDGGLRQQLLRLKDAPGARVVDVRKGEEHEESLVKSFQHLLHNSKFCLNPRGDAPSSQRLFDSIATGCLPVLISDKLRLPYYWRIYQNGSFSVLPYSPPSGVDSVYMPLQWAVPYEQFAVRILEADFMQNPRTIAEGLLRFNVSIANCMQRHMKRAAHILSYSRGGDPLQESAIPGGAGTYMLLEFAAKAAFYIAHSARERTCESQRARLNFSQFTHDDFDNRSPDNFKCLDPFAGAPEIKEVLIVSDALADGVVRLGVVGMCFAFVLCVLRWSALSRRESREE